MNQDLRRPVVAALIALAVSADYRDRADAGRALAVFADAPEAWEPLRRLVLDGGDTFVTLTTAEALLRRQDEVGLTVVAEALASADAQQQSYVDDAVTAVFQLFASERDQAMEVCDRLARDSGGHVRRGAAELRELLAQLDPILHPQEPT